MLDENNYTVYQRMTKHTQHGVLMQCYLLLVCVEYQADTLEDPVRVMFRRGQVGLKHQTHTHRIATV